MLYFQRRFFDVIRHGEKTQTIRLWKTQRVKLGQNCYVPGLGRVAITSIAEVELADLTDDDALRDGFASLAELRGEIERLYPQGLVDGRRVWKIGFAYAAAESTSRAEH